MKVSFQNFLISKDCNPYLVPRLNKANIMIKQLIAMVPVIWDVVIKQLVAMMLIIGES